MNAGTELLIALSVIAGIAGVEIGDLSWAWGTLPIGSALGLYGFLNAGSRNPLRGLRRGGWHKGWIAMLFAGIGMLASGFEKPALPKEDPRAGSIVEGVVERVMTPASGEKALVKLSRITDPVTGHISEPYNLKAILSTKERATLHGGDRIATVADLKRITDNPDYPLSAGYAERMSRKGVYYTGDSRGEIRVTGSRFSLKAAGESLRVRLQGVIDASGLGHDTRDFLSTMLLGDSASLDPDTRRAFSDAGISHILAVSGMHVGILAAIVTGLLLPLNLLGMHRFRWIAVIPVVWFFVLVTGMQTSTVRAAIMITFCMISLARERKRSPMRALLWSVIVILIFDPKALYDAGFQLSVVCVACLILFAERFNTVDRRRHPKLYKANALLITALVATGASWVISSYHFSQVSLLFIPANIVALPLLPLYVGLAMAYLAASACGIRLTLLGKILDCGYGGLLQLVDWISGNGEVISDFRVGIPTLLLWGAALVLLALALYRWHSARGYCAAGAMAALALVTIPLFRQQPVGDGFVITRGLQGITMTGYAAGEADEIRFPTGTVSGISAAGKQIVALDAFPDVSEYPAIRKADLIIVGGGWNGKIEELVQMAGRGYKGDIVLHSSINRKREDLLLHDADSISVAVHSLRRDGSYRYFRAP